MTDPSNRYPDTSEHGPCCDGGAPVRSNLPAILHPDTSAWLRRRLDHGEAKYGAVLRVGWTRAHEALGEELADAVAYAVALDDSRMARQIAVMLDAHLGRSAVYASDGRSPCGGVR